MKIKEQTRKLAACCSKHCFEVVDKTDEVSYLYLGKMKLTLFEEILEEYLLDYNLPATASKSSWILAWLLPPAMAMSGLPPPRPSTIGANSLTRFPA